MGEAYLMLKLSLCFVFFFSTSLFAVDVLVPKRTINYKAIISIKDLSYRKVDRISKVCKPLTLSHLEKNTFQAKHLLLQGRPICTKDVKIYKKESIVFNFGSLEIEKNGKVIYENNEYIKLKRNDGKIEKIYKNGRIE